MDRVLLISGSRKGVELFTTLLNESGYPQADITDNGADARRRLINGDYALVIVNAPLTDEFGSELAIHACEESDSGVILAVKNELSDETEAKVADYGVLVVAKPFSRQVFSSALKFVSASRKRIAGLRYANRTLVQKVEDLRVIDRAKCALIQYLGLSESQAHRHIEKQAMDMRRAKRSVAEDILRTYEP